MPLRSRPSQWFARAFWCVLLLLGVVFQPALMVASEVHASAHLFATGHSHDAEHAEAGIPPDETIAADGLIWENLMHIGHCCGHSTAMPVAMFVLDALVPASPPQPHRAAGAREAMPSQLFRPPNFG